MEISDTPTRITLFSLALSILMELNLPDRGSQQASQW